MNIVLILFGIYCVLAGADKLTDGAVSIARKLSIPELVIGLTIVALGTSMPELFVSLVSALRGTSDLAVGNVIGSNIFNALLIVGVSALVAPMKIMKSTVRKDIPFALLSSVLLLLLCLDGDISRIDAALFFVCFVFFMFLTLKSANNSDVDVSQDELTTLKAIVYLVIGLIGLILGSNLFVMAATKVAESLGVSQAVIGLTIVAGGTSLPELATSVVSAKKGQSGIAIGNVLGSNVLNILLILGLTGVISPLHIVGITWIDYAVAVFSMLLLWLFSYTKYKISRSEGAFLCAVFLGYMAYLLINLVH